ncbi:MAG: regulatory protein RecX, partial [Myxococcales bacterium]
MSDERPARRERPKPRKISPRYLENAALHYLKRYSTSVANLRRVLLRKIDRSVKAHGGERAAYAPMVEELLAKLERNALLDDAAFARTRVASLQRRGTSRRAIRAKLQLKGVPKELLE